MKNIVYYIAIATVLLFASCASELDTEPSGSQVSDEQLGELIKENADLVLAPMMQGAVNYMHTGNRQATTNDRGFMVWNLGMDLQGNDMVLTKLTNWFADVYMFESIRAQTNAYTADRWYCYYKIVYQSNQILDLIPDDVTGKALVYKAQALTYRALAYYYLMCVYQVDDSQIIDLFFVRSELAISELDAKYGKVCHKLAHNILDSRQDAEECVNDAYLGTWNAIPPQRPDPLLPFVCVLVRRYSIMRYRANTAMKRNSSYDACMEEIENCIAAPGRVEDHYEAKVLARTIERFLDTLNRENRVIFMRRYWYSDSYAAIAALTGLTEKNVSVRLARVRKQLRDYLMKQGVLT